jgi:hypothetical protein
LFFRSEDHLGRWSREAEIERGSAVPVQTVADLGRLWYADRLHPDWQPKTADTMERILRQVGLTDPFWSVR